jgi:hypothetical protein
MQLLKLEWEKVGWINITTMFTLFPWQGLPQDVHFTFSYHPGSDMMNLHLSRNIAGVSSENKPHIRIAQWPKAEMEEMAKILFYRYWQQAWRPFDMAKYQYRPSAKGQTARYCSITRPGKPGKEQVIHRQLNTHLLKHLGWKRKGRHLIVQEVLIPTLEKLAFRSELF